jgi:hypothetical protein
VNEAKIQAMADTFRTLINMTSRPIECLDELIGLLGRDKTWTPEELLAVRDRVLPPS